jgi:hypothetical protein
LNTDWDELYNLVPENSGLDESEPTEQAPDEEEDMDMEEEVPDTTIKKKNSKKQKKGIIVRNQINSVVMEMTGTPSGEEPQQPNVEVRKRKTGSSDSGTEAETA